MNTYPIYCNFKVLAQIKLWLILNGLLISRRIIYYFSASRGFVAHSWPCGHIQS